MLSVSTHPSFLPSLQMRCSSCSREDQEGSKGPQERAEGLLCLEDDRRPGAPDQPPANSWVSGYLLFSLCTGWRFVSWLWSSTRVCTSPQPQPTMLLVLLGRVTDSSDSSPPNPGLTRSSLLGVGGGGRFLPTCKVSLWVGVTSCLPQAFTCSALGRGAPYLRRTHSAPIGYSPTDRYSVITVSSSHTRGNSGIIPSSGHGGHGGQEWDGGKRARGLGGVGIYISYRKD